MDQALRVAARKLYEAHSKNVPHALRWEQLSPEIQNKWGVEHQERSAVEHDPVARAKRAVEDHDPVNHPSHYTSSPSGIECIQVTEHMTFCLGNAVKYLWRAGEKGNLIQDLEKAVWYINREIARLSTGDATLPPVQTSTDNGVTWQPSKEVKVWPTVAESKRAEMLDKVRAERDEYRESKRPGDDETAAAFFGETVEEFRKARADAKLARDLEKRGDR